MKIITKPMKEKSILASTRKNTSKKQIVKGMISKAEYCVDHLCGCGK
ncbi:MAG: hypothetical protein MUO31_02245 [Thermodesulfovibrionales bacterium]|nr:hypothetical protein [Thermodesulfovibrionales bacterium]